MPTRALAHVPSDDLVATAPATRPVPRAHLDASPGSGQLTRLSATPVLFDVVKEIALDEAGPAEVDAVPGARTLALHRALRRLATTYVGGPWLDRLEVGRVVTLADPELDDLPLMAMVSAVIPGGCETLVDLLVLDPVAWAQDTREG